MERKQAADFLKLPYKELVDLALSAVNLTAKERKVLDLRYLQGYTQEETAEILDASVNSVQNWEKAALVKCADVWNGKKWILKIIEQT